MRLPLICFSVHQACQATPPASTGCYSCNQGPLLVLKKLVESWHGGTQGLAASLLILPIGCMQLSVVSTRRMVPLFVKLGNNAIPMVSAQEALSAVLCRKLEQHKSLIQLEYELDFQKNRFKREIQARLQPVVTPRLSSPAIALRPLMQRQQGMLRVDMDGCSQFMPLRPIARVLCGC